jgi:hypothetical protein
MLDWTDLESYSATIHNIVMTSRSLNLSLTHSDQSDQLGRHVFQSAMLITKSGQFEHRQPEGIIGRPKKWDQ